MCGIHWRNFCKFKISRWMSPCLETRIGTEFLKNSVADLHIHIRTKDQNIIPWGFKKMGQECIPVGCLPSSRNRTWGGGSPWQRPLDGDRLDGDPLDRDRDALDGHPSGQRPPRTETTTPTPTLNKITDMCSKTEIEGSKNINLAPSFLG